MLVFSYCQSFYFIISNDTTGIFKDILTTQWFYILQKTFFIQSETLYYEVLKFLFV